MTSSSWQCFKQSDQAICTAADAVLETVFCVDI